MSVIDIDLGWKRIRRDLEQADRTFVKIGVQEGSKREGGGPSLVVVAAANEFGTKRIPERSFLRSAYDQHAVELRAAIDRGFALLLAGRASARKVLELVGLQHVAQVQAKIRSNIQPPNAPATLAARRRRSQVLNPEGAPKTLVDTGQLVQSIRHQVYQERA